MPSAASASARLSPTRLTLAARESRLRRVSTLAGLASSRGRPRARGAGSLDGEEVRIQRLAAVVHLDGDVGPMLLQPLRALGACSPGPAPSPSMRVTSSWSSESSLPGARTWPRPPTLPPPPRRRATVRASRPLWIGPGRAGGVAHGPRHLAGHHPARRLRHGLGVVGGARPRGRTRAARRTPRRCRSWAPRAPSWWTARTPAWPRDGCCRCWAATRRRGRGRPPPPRGSAPSTGSWTVPPPRGSAPRGSGRCARCPRRWPPPPPPCGVPASSGSAGASAPAPSRTQRSSSICSARLVTRMSRGRPASRAASMAPPTSLVWMWQFHRPSPPTTTMESPRPAHTSLKAPMVWSGACEEVHDLVAAGRCPLRPAPVGHGPGHGVGHGRPARQHRGRRQGPAVDHRQGGVEEQEIARAAGVHHARLGQHGELLGRVGQGLGRAPSGPFHHGQRRGVGPRGVLGPGPRRPGPRSGWCPRRGAAPRRAPPRRPPPGPGPSSPRRRRRRPRPALR